MRENILCIITLIANFNHPIILLSANCLSLSSLRKKETGERQEIDNHKSRFELEEGLRNKIDD